MGILLALILMLFPAERAVAVDETASMIIAMGQIRLGDIDDRIAKQYADKKGVYWNIVGSAYHDFSAEPRTDVIIGIAGYKDVGVIYNSERQMVEDAGSGFAYFHKSPKGWKLIQVDLATGKKYEGYQGADLTAQGGDQLVVYSASVTTKYADIYHFDGKGYFHKAATVHGFGEGLSVVEDAGKPLLVAYQRAMIKNGDEFQIYYGRPFRWNGREFQLDRDDFLDRVQSYDPVHSLRDESEKDLEFFENCLSGHPDNFCALADCYDLSRRLELNDKAAQYRARLIRNGKMTSAGPNTDPWIGGKNQVAWELSLEWVAARK